MTIKRLQSYRMTFCYHTLAVTIENISGKHTGPVEISGSTACFEFLVHWMFCFSNKENQLFMHFEKVKIRSIVV